MVKPYLVIHPIGGRRISEFVFMHQDGGACFLDLGWDQAMGRHPFHLIDGPIELVDGSYRCGGGVVVQELKPEDPLWSSWLNWLDYRRSPDGKDVKDEDALEGCKRNGALINQPLTCI
ncbi:MAG: hypothetical protein CVU69_10480 [Deltaproteobacteria bacterium HGW-Deltaproteobacteria-4]|nr:MAG: hypothetical protein CVU69_10480 [Deltaproteobacteria bacterium HGW-Deltaproteobacteria-4]